MKWFKVTILSMMLLFLDEAMANANEITISKPVEIKLPIQKMMAKS